MWVWHWNPVLPCSKSWQLYKLCIGVLILFCSLLIRLIAARMNVSTKEVFFFRKTFSFILSFNRIKGATFNVCWLKRITFMRIGLHTLYDETLDHISKVNVARIDSSHGQHGQRFRFYEGTTLSRIF